MKKSEWLTKIRLLNETLKMLLPDLRNGDQEARQRVEEETTPLLMFAVIEATAQQIEDAITKVLDKVESDQLEKLTFAYFRRRARWLLSDQRRSAYLRRARSLYETQVRDRSEIAKQPHERLEHAQERARHEEQYRLMTEILADGKLAKTYGITDLQRCVLDLKYNQGFVQQEIAKQLEVDPSTVSEHVRRGNKKLRKAISDMTP